MFPVVHQVKENLGAKRVAQSESDSTPKRKLHEDCGLCERAVLVNLLEASRPLGSRLRAQGTAIEIRGGAPQVYFPDSLANQKHLVSLV